MGVNWSILKTIGESIMNIEKPKRRPIQLNDAIIGILIPVFL
jgi:hypothetical protein